MKTVKDWLKKQGLTQRQFAALLGSHEVEVSRWLNGKKKPSLQTLDNMAKVTGLKLQTLAEDVQ